MVPRLYMLMVPHFKSGEYCDSSCAQIWFPSPKLGICLKGTSNKKQFQLVWKNNPCGSQESSMTFFWGDLESQKLGSFETLGPQKQLVSPWKKHQVPHEISWGTGGKPIFIYPLDSWLQIHTYHITVYGRISVRFNGKYPFAIPSANPNIFHAGWPIY
jgi:hypothetical protein